MTHQAAIEFAKEKAAIVCSVLQHDGDDDLTDPEYKLPDGRQIIIQVVPYGTKRCSALIVILGDKHHGDYEDLSPVLTVPLDYVMLKRWKYTSATAQSGQSALRMVIASSSSSTPV
jgi:hypothetical protein